MNGIDVVIKGFKELFCIFYYLRVYEVGSIYELGSDFLKEFIFVSFLILVFLGFKIWKNKFFLL